MPIIKKMQTPKKLSKEGASRIEQRTLTITLCLVVLMVIGSLIFGVRIQSDVVILNGIFSLFSLIGSWLSLTAAKLVARPADKSFQYGYWHVEPLVHCANSLMMSAMCLYAFLNGLEGLRSGGHVVDAVQVIWFGAISGTLCGTVGLYELFMANKIDSELLRNDAREWLMDFAFSLVTLGGFAGLFILPEPLRSTWAYYADSALVSFMALLLIPFPLRVFVRNFREVLRITGSEEILVERVTAALEHLKKEDDVVSYSSHILKVGRTYFVEVNILVGPEFSFQSIARQDELREIIWKNCGKSLDDLWLSLCVTADKRWL